VVAGVKREQDLGKNGVDYVSVLPDRVNGNDDDNVDESDSYSDGDSDDYSSLDYDDDDVDDDDDAADDDNIVDDVVDDIVDAVGDVVGDFVGLHRRKKGDTLDKQEQSQSVLTLAHNDCAMKFQAQRKVEVGMHAAMLWPCVLSSQKVLL
jgi:hypothetical protein